MRKRNIAAKEQSLSVHFGKVETAATMSSNNQQSLLGDPIKFLACVCTIFAVVYLAWRQCFSFLTRTNRRNEQKKRSKQKNDNNSKETDPALQGPHQASGGDTASPRRRPSITSTPHHDDDTPAHETSTGVVLGTNENVPITMNAPEKQTVPPDAHKENDIQDFYDLLVNTTIHDDDCPSHQRSDHDHAATPPPPAPDACRSNSNSVEETIHEDDVEREQKETNTLVETPHSRTCSQEEKPPFETTRSLQDQEELLRRVTHQNSVLEIEKTIAQRQITILREEISAKDREIGALQAELKFTKSDKNENSSQKKTSMSKENNDGIEYTKVSTNVPSAPARLGIETTDDKKQNKVSTPPASTKRTTEPPSFILNHCEMDMVATWMVVKNIGMDLDPFTITEDHNETTDLDAATTPTGYESGDSEADPHPIREFTRLYQEYSNADEGDHELRHFLYSKMTRHRKKNPELEQVASSHFQSAYDDICQIQSALSQST